MRAKPKSRSSTAPSPPGLPIGALALRAELRAGMAQMLARFDLAGLKAEIALGRDSLWLFLRRPEHGGLALRAAFAPGGLEGRMLSIGVDHWTVRLESSLGRYDVAFTAPQSSEAFIRITSTLTPSADLLIPFLPRDLYPLDADDDPTAAEGVVQAAQRGLNSGLVYFCVREPAFGNVLYFQNLTALNPYFQATGTKPDGVVGGQWPELGYQPPTAPLGHSPPVLPLLAGQPVVVSDALLTVRFDCASSEQDNAAEFLDMLALIYGQLDKPSTEYRDWPARAEKTLTDLKTSPKATIKHYDHLYVHPYTDAEYPDSMVQMTVLSSIRDYAAARRETIPFADALSAGMGKFYDPQLKSLRRYLPNVGKDKNKNAVDSWYLYHPLLNMGRLAIAGDARLKRLFLKSVDFGIKAAEHFDYKWPIQFNVLDFSVITEARNDDGLGQTDVGGIFAYVMLQAYELTGEDRFLRRAKGAIDAARGMRFELNYQANLTAWGAVACLRLWRITEDRRYLKQSYVYLASFFHNCEIWESNIKHAEHYKIFLGATCLHDAPYMAIYECFESFAAFEQYLRESGPDVAPSVKTLLSEYCKFSIDRAWYYYPDALPKAILATENRNGHIDPSLSFPLEDLYGDGQPPGQVGQEIYGCGAAFTYAAKSFHLFDNAPFSLFCDHFLMWTDSDQSNLRFTLAAGPGSLAKISLSPTPGRSMPTMRVLAGDHEVKPVGGASKRTDYEVPGDLEIHIQW